MGSRSKSQSPTLPSLDAFYEGLALAPGRPLRFDPQVIGTLLNVLAVIAGGLVGRSSSWEPSPASQTATKLILGGFTVWVGLSTVWASISGTLLQGLGQIGLALLALMLGHLTGQLLRLQHYLNRLGRFSRDHFTEAARSGRAPGFSAAFLSCTVLFAINPLGIFGGVLDGATQNWKILAIKSAMDGLAALSFSRAFGWGTLAAALPLAAFQGSVTLGAEWLATCMTQPQIEALGATTGLLVFSVSLIILELRKVELANYLPSLVYAPLLAALLRG